MNFSKSGSAQIYSDYNLSTTLVNIPQGSSVGSFFVNTYSDPGANRAVTFTLQAPTGYNLGSDSTNTLTIIEPAAVPHTVQFSVGSETVNESAGTFSIPMTVSQAPSTYFVQVQAMVGGTAVSGTDYSNLSATVTFYGAVYGSSGTTTGTITGTLLSDPGPNKTLTFSLSSYSSGGYSLGSPSVNTLTIIEPAPVTTPPSVAAPASQSATEGLAQSVNLGSFSDSANGPWNVDVNWGDGTSDTTYSVNSAGSLGAQSHTYAAVGTDSVRVNVTNTSDSLTGFDIFSLPVVGVALTATATPVTTAIYATPFSGEVATFTDANPNAPLSAFPLANATIKWGDGATSNATSITQDASGVFHVFGTHTYGQAGATASPLQVTIDDVGGAVSNTTNYTPTVGQANASPSVAPYSVTFDGNAHTATGSATGANGYALPSSDFTLTGTTHTTAGAYNADAWSFNDPSGNYQSASGTVSDTIGQANASVAYSGYTGGTYDGSQHTQTVTVTGVGSDGTLFTTSLSGINAGSYSQPWSFSNANYNSVNESGALAFTIGKVNSTTAITIAPGTYTYTGSAQTPASVSVTGPGGLSLTPTANYLSNVNAGSATANYSFAGNANYNPSSDSKTFVITQASSTTATLGAGPFTYTGSAQIGGSGTVTGAGGLSTAATSLTYSANSNGTGTADETDAGAYYVTAHNAGDANHQPSDGAAVAIVINQANATFTVTPYTVTYDGNPHTASSTTITGVNGQTGATVGIVTLNTTHTAAGIYSSDSWSFAGTANYNNITSTPITDTINKATLTITVTSDQMLAGNSIPPLTGTVNGAAFTGSTTVTITHTGAPSDLITVTLNCTATTSSTAGSTYPITAVLTGAASADYVSPAAGTLYVDSIGRVVDPTNLQHASTWIKTGFVNITPTTAAATVTWLTSQIADINTNLGLGMASSDVVYAGGLLNFLSILGPSSGLDGGGFITVANLLTLANAGFANYSGAARGTTGCLYMAALAQALQNANEDLSFVQQTTIPAGI